MKGCFRERRVGVSAAQTAFVNGFVRSRVNGDVPFWSVFGSLCRISCVKGKGIDALSCVL